MTALRETLTGIEDRAIVLATILGHQKAVPGNTLIAYVEPESLVVGPIRSMVTPTPSFDAHSCFPSEHIDQLSRQLREIARSLVPGPIWWDVPQRVPTGELITVVCRGGDQKISSTETQFGWAWRYANHLTMAFDGDVFAATPRGWVSDRGPQWSAEAPCLRTSFVVGGDPAVVEAEQILTDAAVALRDPGARECLQCYVLRMLESHGCGGGLQFTKSFRDIRAPRATRLEERIARSGGACDCDVLEGFHMAEHEWRGIHPLAADGVVVERSERPDRIPDCTGVRQGSTQPCSLWYASLPSLRW